MQQQVLISHSSPRVHDTESMTVVIVGAGCVGKTALISKLLTGRSEVPYDPTFRETYVCHHLTVDARPVNLKIYEIGGMVDVKRLRTSIYPDADVVIICFSVDSPSSLELAKEEYKPEVAHYVPGKPIILVSMKVELRDDARTIRKLQQRNIVPVSREKGQKAADRIGAHKYVECSAETGEGVSAVFYEACKAVYLPPRKGKLGKRKK